MKTPLVVSLIQMNIVPENVEHNTRVAFAMMEKALIHNPRVLLLPEMWSTDFLGQKNKSIAASTPYVLQKIQAFCKSHKVYVLGSMPELVDSKMYNTMYTIDPQGKIAHTYQKVHLFTLTGEHISYSAGNKPSTLQTPFGKWGNAICFDIRFADFINKTAQEGIDILFVSAQWPWERQEHWENLLKARAIENQIFVVGCNRVGISNGLEYAGNSLIYDPWGDLLAEGSTIEEVIHCTIDLSRIKEVRQKLPMN